MSLRTCANGHQFQKSTSCPVCPICEQKRKPGNGFLSLLAAPARRALEKTGIRTVNELAAFREEEILALHGMGPGSMPILRQAMQEKGVKFRS